MTNIYRGYNIDTAVRLLGPADYTAPNVSQSFSQALTNAIVLIWKSIARIYNLIFGDRLWYDNGVACRLFISASLQNDATPANWVALDRLREQLQSRAQKPTFYTSGPCSLAQFVEEEIHNEIFNLTASQARLSPPPKRNILAEKIVRFNKKQEKAEWSQIAQDNPALAKDIRRQRVALSPSEIQLAAQQIALNLADQTLFAIDLLPTDEIDLSQMNHKQCNALLQQLHAPSPVKLQIAEALNVESANEIMAALRERGILCALTPNSRKDRWIVQVDSLQFGAAEAALTNRFTSNENGTRLLFDIYKDPLSPPLTSSQASSSSSFAEDEFTSWFRLAMGEVNDPELLLPRANYLIKRAFAASHRHTFYVNNPIENMELAIYELLRISKLERNGCGIYHLNICGQSVNNDEIKVYMALNASELIPHLLSHPTYLVTAKMLMNQSLNGHSDSAQLKDLIKIISQNLYSSQLWLIGEADVYRNYYQPLPVIMPTGNTPEICLQANRYDYHNAGRSTPPMTPQAFIEAKLTEVTQTLASEGVILQTDIDGDLDNIEILPHATKLICTMAAFHLIHLSETSPEGKLRLSEHVSIECGTFYYHHAFGLEDGTVVFKPVEQETPNLLGYAGESTDAPSDSMAAKWLMNQLNPEEIEFAKSMSVAPLLKALYDAKRTPNAEIDQFIDTSRQRLRELYRNFPRSSDAIFQLGHQITQIAASLQRSFDNCVMQMVGTYDAHGNLLKAGSVKFLPGALPSSSTSRILSLVPVGNKILREVKWEYLPALSHDQINEAIRNTKPLREPSKPRVSLPAGSKLSKYRSKSALKEQNHLIGNGARYGSCAYGALGYHLFQPDLSTDDGVIILRNAIADYIKKNPNAYREALSAEGYSDELSAEYTIDDFCMQVLDGNRWSTNIEMAALSEIFGVPIHVFDISDKSKGLKVGAKGTTDQGILLPSHVIGERFGKHPIRVIYNGAHYQALVYKT